MPKRTLVAATVAITALTVLTACSPDREDTHTAVLSETPIYAFPEHETDPLFTNHWFSDGENTIIVNLHGSSSCPPTIATSTLKDTELHLWAPPTPDTPCTDDYGGPHSHIITLNPDETVTIVKYDDTTIDEIFYD